MSHSAHVSDIRKGMIMENTTPENAAENKTPSQLTVRPLTVILLVALTALIVDLYLHNRPATVDDSGPASCGDLTSIYEDNYYEQHGTYPSTDEIDQFRAAGVNC